MFDLVMLVSWTVLGMVNLCIPKPVSKFSYFCVWFLVVLYWGCRVFG